MTRTFRYLPRLQVRWLAETTSGHGGAEHRTIPGTLVFADVSGFTALSERLARRGRAGAEELTDLINAVLCRMLAVTRPLGGDLLKYGGDALLLLFSGSEHQRRAVAAAAGMRNALREYRSFSSESGRVSLQMSIGVEAGDVEGFLVGVHHRELMVAGPAVSRVVQLQDASPAREIVLGENVAAGLPHRWLGPAVPGGGRLLRTRSHRLSEVPDGRGGSPSPPVGTARPWDEPDPYPPPATELALAGVPTALHAALGSVDGEHRQVAVGFVECRGLDTLLAREGPVAAAHALHALVEVTSYTCAEHEVTFLATDAADSAVKLVIVAGAPTTASDNEDRLLAVLRALVDTPTSLPVRAGAHTGQAFAVEVGDDERRVYTVLGDTVNLAARMMAAAPDSALLTTSRVLDRLRVPYGRQPVEPLTVKGFTAPVEAALVGPVAPVMPPSRRNPLPFVGRQVELDQILEAFDAARDGRRRVVDIVGEPGIGKSRLLAEALTHLGELPALLVRPRLYARTEPYGGIREPLRRLLQADPAANRTDGGIEAGTDDEAVAGQLARRMEEHLPDRLGLLPLLGVPFGLRLPETEASAALSADHRRDELLTTTIQLLLRLFPPTGVLAIEDPYWLDDGSEQLLARLIRVLPGWTVLITHRPGSRKLELSEVADTERLRLGPLPASAVHALASSSGRLSPEEASGLAARSGGNPLFLEELAAAVAGGASLDELPDTVEAVIAAHLDTLDSADRDLVRLASVLGTDFPTGLLFDLAGVGDADAGQARLRRLNSVLRSGEETTRFTHALLRESAYAGLSFRRRRTLHGRAADLILAGRSGSSRLEAAPEPPADLLALHYSAAHRHEDCWRWSLVAAERAWHDAAPVEAVAQFRRALDSARPAGATSRQIAAVYEDLGDVAEVAGLYDTAADAYRRARHLRRADPAAAAGLLRKQGDIAEREGRYPIALRYYARGLRALEAADASAEADSVRVTLTLMYGGARLRQGRYRDAIRVLADAVRLAEGANDRAALAHAYYLLDWVHTDLGRPEPRYRALALPIYQELGDWRGQGNVLNNLGIDAYYEGRWDSAVEYYRLSGEAFGRIGATVLAATATHNIGEILCDQGYFEEARAELSRAREIWKLSGYPGTGLATANLGRLAARTGSFEEAGVLLAEGKAGLLGIGADSVVVDVELRELERLVLMGCPDDALSLAAAVRTRAEQPVQQAILHRMTGWARAQRGDFDAAAVALATGLWTAQQVGAKYEEARIRAALARVTSLRTGEPVTDGEADAILARLGVIWSPAPPLPSAVNSG